MNISWAAGLFEGEGHVSHGKSRRYPEVGLTSTDYDVITNFHKVIGIGNVSGPYDKGYKPCWKWSAYGVKNVQITGLLFWRYLGKRRRRAFASALAGHYLEVH